MYHRKTSSQDSSASSSSDHATLAAAGGASMASDLRGVSTPPTSPGLSPLGSPRLPREGVPTELEKSIRIDKGSKQLGKLGIRVIAGHCLLSARLRRTRISCTDGVPMQHWHPDS